MSSEMQVQPGLAAAQVILKPKKARPFYGRHPWVLDSAVDRVQGKPAEGAIVDLMSHNGKFVGRGLYNPHSRIRVRLYTWEAGQPIDTEFWTDRITQAVSL